MKKLRVTSRSLTVSPMWSMPKVSVFVVILQLLNARGDIRLYASQAFGGEGDAQSRVDNAKISSVE